MKAGQFFDIMNFIIQTILEISHQPGKLNECNVSPITIMEFVLRMSNSERNVIYFLFFEKSVFRSSFIRYFPNQIVNNFSFFFQAMWELFKIDQKLLESLISYDVGK